jgi:hypothetical protein
MYSWRRAPGVLGKRPDVWPQAYWMTCSERGAAAASSGTPPC